MKWYQSKFNLALAGIMVAGVGAIIVFAQEPETPPEPTSTPSVLAARYNPVFTIGRDDAPVTVVQYSDFMCPGCSQVSLSVIPKMIENYVDKGLVRYQFQPMAFVVQDSVLAGEGALCAAEQDKFWQFHDAAYLAVWNGFFSKGVEPWDVTLYKDGGMADIARQAGVDVAAFDTCMSSHAKLADIRDLTLEAQNKGVSGTPYITVKGQAIKGIPTYQMLEAAIKAAL